MCLSLRKVDDLVEVEAKETKLRILKPGEGDFKELTKNMISFSSRKYMRGKIWREERSEL